MQAVTLEIILRAVFGLGEGERLERLRRELRALLDKLTNPRMLLLPLLLGPERLARFSSFRHAMARVDRPIYDEIGERRAAGDLDERSGVLALLLQARHENGEAMTDREVRDELVTLLVAGHETTATALAWAVERLARHPDKLERLAEEVRAGATGYLDAVVLPPSPAGRPLPRARALPSRALPRRAAGHYTWIPFGGGVRRCLGSSFAQSEMRAVLGELVRRRSLRPTRTRPEATLRRAITETPRHDAEVVL